VGGRLSRQRAAAADDAAIIAVRAGARNRGCCWRRGSAGGKSVGGEERHAMAVSVSAGVGSRGRCSRPGAEAPAEVEGHAAGGSPTQPAAADGAGGEVALAGPRRRRRRAAAAGGAVVAAITAGGRGRGSCWQRRAVMGESVGEMGCTRWCLVAAAAVGGGARGTGGR